MSFNRKSLHLIILPTEKCNFRCTYCYEDFAVGRMPEAIVGGIKKLIQRRVDAGTLDHLHLDWFGGEPLLARGIIKELAAFGCELERRHAIKSLTGALTTNGYRLELDTLKELTSLKQCDYQISLDGYGPDHDRTRRRADGSGTFDRIWKNLLSASEWGSGTFNITLRLHVTQESYRNMPKLCREIGAAFGGDKRFKVFIKRVTNLGGPHADTIKAVRVTEAVNVAREAETYLANAGVPFIDGLNAKYESQRSDSAPDAPAKPCSLLESVQSAPYICYAAKPNSFVIRATGRLAKCTVAFDDPKNDVGFIDPDGRLHIDSGKVGYWTRGLLSGAHDELGCPANDYAVAV